MSISTPPSQDSSPDTGSEADHQQSTSNQTDPISPDTFNTSGTDIQVRSGNGFLPLPHSPSTENCKLPIGPSPEAQERSPVVHPPGERLLTAIWRSTDLCHQLGTLDRQSHRFKNLPVDGVADAVAQALKLSSEGKEVYFACAEYLTPDSRESANAYGARAFWMDIDCGEEKAAAGKGYPTVEKAEVALSKFCKDAKLPKPTHIVHSGGGLHVYWVLDDVVTRDTWQEYARQLKALTIACGFLADPSRTADIASVLRLPGTLNHKYSPPKPVVLNYGVDDAY